MTDATDVAQQRSDGAWSFEALDPRARWGMRLRALLHAFVLLGMGLAVLLAVVTKLDVAVPGVTVALALAPVLVLAVVLALAYAGARWRRTRFALTPQGLRIRRGVWWRSDTLVPRSRVQHIDLHRGPLDRRLGLAGLRVFTAGSELGRISLNGLPVARAEALRDALVQGDDHGL